jgi:uncharacterized protein (TIGR02217 family)
MAYKDMLLPIGFALDWTSAPGFDTDVLVMDNGNEARNQNLSGNRVRLSIKYNAQNRTQWQAIDDFIQIAGGRAHSFRVRDPRRNTATTAEGKIVGSQMVYRTTVGAYTFDKTITKPDSTVTLSGGGSFSTSTGLITSGSPTAWSGKFYLCMRFDVDALEVTGLDRAGDGSYIARFNDVPLVEVLGE